MNVYYAKVENVAEENPSIISCSILGEDGKSWGEGQPVVYTSPFSRIDGFITKGGMTAFPQRGDHCLIIKPSNANILFYMASVPYPSASTTDSNVDDTPKDLDMNLLDPFKRSWSIQDDVGGIIEYRDAANDHDTNTYVQVRSNPSTFTMNRKVKHESIYTRVKGGETHTVMTGPDNEVSPNGAGFLRTQAQNNMEHISLYGTIKVQAEAEARKIKIVNYGSPLVATDEKKAGDIDIESFHNTVNIRGGVSAANSAPKVGVFVQAGIGSGGSPVGALAGKSIIQVNSAGKVQVLAGSQGIEVYSKGKIDMKADGPIKIQGSRIDLNPNSPVVVTPETNNLNDQVVEANQGTDGLITGGFGE